MEKKFFLFIPLFFLLFSFLFPIKGGSDRYFVRSADDAQTEIQASFSSYFLQRSAGMVMTCNFSNEDIIVSGFLDGTLLVNGRPLENMTQSKYKTIYAVAASEDGEYLAVIAGLYPRTLYVYQKKQENWNLSRRINLADDVRRTPFLAFSDNILLFEDVAGLSVLNMTTFNLSSMEFNGILKDVAFDPEEEYVWVVSTDETGDHIRMFLYNGSLVASGLYDGRDSLSALRVVEQ